MVRVTYTPPPPQPADEPGPIPLTHHEIIALVGPFSERGRHVDLAGSDRANRAIRFRPLDHAADGDRTPALVEVLTLAVSEARAYRLTRTLTGPGGLAATLTIDGDDPGTLLAEVERVPPARQFPIRAGVPIARHYRILRRTVTSATSAAAADAAPAPSPAPAPPWQVELTGVTACLDGVLFTANARTGRGLPAELELRAANDARLAVPPDLLAVLGWDWRPLRPFGKAWRGSVRIPRAEPERTRVAEIKLNRAVEHLARTLRQTPAAFHTRYHGARWRVTFQRAIPLLVGLTLLAITPLVQFLDLKTESIIRMLIFHAPPILMILMFTMREMPIIEVPPLPRPLRARQWVQG